MTDFTAKIEGALKDKRVLVGGAVVVGVGALYLLSHNGGGGFGASIPGSTQPVGDTTPQPQADSGSSASDTAGLAQALAEQQSQNATFQSKLQSALDGVINSVSQALNQQAQQNQSGLSQLAAQTNAALAGLAGQQSQQAIPDFSGFESQLVASLQSQIQQATRPLSTGFLQQSMFPSIGQPVRLPAITGTAARTPTPAFQLGSGLGSLLGSLSLGSLSGYKPTSTPNPTQLGRQVGSGVGSYLSGFVSKLQTGYQQTLQQQKAMPLPTTPYNPFAGAKSSISGSLRYGA